MWPAPTPHAAPPARTPLLSVATDQPEFVEVLARQAGTRIPVRRQRVRVDGSPLEPERLVKEALAESTTVLCFGPDVPLELAFAAAEFIDLDAPELVQFAVTTPTPAVWREAARTGLREIVDPANLEQELEAALERILEREARIRDLRASTPTKPRTGRIIPVISPKGGSGKTMFSTNLAVCLARLGIGPVVLADFDVQFGDAASAFAMVPEHTLSDLASVRTLDATVLKVYLTPHQESGAYVLCGATSPEEGDAVSDELTRRVVRLLARDFAFVVVDTAAGLDETALTVIEEATDLVLLSSLDVSSIRSLGKEIQTLDRIGLLGPTRHFVLNRADARVGLEIADVEAALGMAVDVAVPSSRDIPLSMNQGRPVALDQPEGGPAEEIMRFARSLAGVPDPEKARGLFRRKKP
jgi:pilus assembly protein CpaE